MQEPDNKTVIVEARTVLESGTDVPKGLEGSLETPVPHPRRKRAGTAMMASGIVAVAVSLAMWIPEIAQPEQPSNDAVPVVVGETDQNAQSSEETLPVGDNSRDSQNSPTDNQANEADEKESRLFNFTDGLTLAGLTASQKGSYALQSRGRFSVVEEDSETPLLVVDPTQGNVSVSGPLDVTGDVTASHADLAAVKAKSVTSESATIDTADVSGLSVENEHVESAHVAAADIESATVESLQSLKSDTESLSAQNAQLGDVLADSLTTSGLTASGAEISGGVSANEITTEELRVGTAEISGASGENLSYTNVSGEQLDIQNGAFKTLSSGTCLVDKLDSSLIDSGAITAESLECDSVIADTLLEAVNARLNFVSAIDISASTLRATTVEADTLSAQEVTTDSVSANWLSVGSLETGSFEADTLSGELVTFKVSNGVRGSVLFEGVGAETQTISVPESTKAVYLSVNYNPNNPYVFASVTHAEGDWKIVCVSQKEECDPQSDDGCVAEEQDSGKIQEDTAFQGIEVCWLAVG